MLVGACGSSVKAMNDLTTVTFYMEPELCQSAQVGQHNFIRKVAGVISDAGLEVRYQPFGLRGVPEGKGWSMSHIKMPPDKRGLCFRRAYHYPFWQIEQTAERWSWDVAQAAFEPDMRRRGFTGFGKVVYSRMRQTIPRAEDIYMSRYRVK